MKNKMRKRIAELLEVHSPGDFWGHAVDVALTVLIMLNIVAVVLASVASLGASYATFFWVFEICSVIIFTIEYIVRVWSCIDRPDNQDKRPIMGRIRYMLTPYALIDLFAILPFYLLTLLGQYDLRFLRIVRLLRLLKITRYSKAMQALFGALRAESDSLAAAFFLLFVLFVLASSGIYLIENKVQPDNFGSIPAAMWWAMTTLTTVGYGDVVPMTVWGKIFGGCITIIGVGMVALPAGIIASGFSDHLKQRRSDCNPFFDILFSASSSTQRKQAALEELQRTLGLSQANAQFLSMASTGTKSQQADKKKPDRVKKRR